MMTIFISGVNCLFKFVCFSVVTCKNIDKSWLVSTTSVSFTK